MQHCSEKIEKSKSLTYAKADTFGFVKGNPTLAVTLYIFSSTARKGHGCLHSCRSLACDIHGSFGSTLPFPFDSQLHSLFAFKHTA